MSKQKHADAAVITATPNDAAAVITATPDAAPAPRIAVVKRNALGAPEIIKTYSNDDVRDVCAALALEGDDAAAIKKRAFSAAGLFDADVIKQINDDAAAVRELNKATNDAINANDAIKPFADARADAAAAVKERTKAYAAAIKNAPADVKTLIGEKRARNLTTYNNGVRAVSNALGLNMGAPRRLTFEKPAAAARGFILAAGDD